MPDTPQSGAPGPIPARPAPRPAPGRRSALTASVVIVGLCLLVAIPLIVSGNMRGRAAHDHLNFHEKVIHRFASEWPSPSIGDYLSATTPGYHLLLAGAASAGLDSRAGLRLVALVFTVVMLGVLACWCGVRAGSPRRAIVACLPLPWSLYVLGSAAWLVPDNAGWAGVVVLLVVALAPRWSWRSAVLGGLGVTLLVTIRQTHVWTAALMWAAAWLGDEPAGPDEPWRRGLFGHVPARTGRAVLAAAATAPAFLVLAWFNSLWGGLVPPSFQNLYQRSPGQGIDWPNFFKCPATPAFFLSLMAVGSVFFAGYWRRGAIVLATRWKGWAVIAVITGLAAALAPDTTYSVPLGRSSGLWNLVQKLPVVNGTTSVLLLVLSPLGALALAAWCASIPRRPRLILLAAFVGFAAAQAASAQLWQRYVEPITLILLALFAAESIRHAPSESEPRWARPARLAGPVLLALLVASITATKLATDRPATDRHRATITDINAGLAPPEAAPLQDRTPP